MKRVTRFVAPILLGVLLGGSATAATITATSTSGSITDWTLVYNDANSDGLVEVSEIVSFSGFLQYTLTGVITNVAIIGTPNIAGVSTESGDTGGTIFGERWGVLDENGGTGGIRYYSVANWTYENDANAGVIPLPATLPTMLLGMLSFAFVRKRLKK